MTLRREILMGGDGSGRIREKETMVELLMNDEEFKESITLKTVTDYTTVISMLMDVIQGREKEYVFNSKGEVLLERPTPLDVRVKAAKVWKEMTLDKVVSDRKVIDNKLQGSLFDLPKMVSEVDALLQALKEKRDKEDVKVGENQIPDKYFGNDTIVKAGEQH